MALAVAGRRLAVPERDPTGVHEQRGYLFDELFTARYDESTLDASSPLGWAGRAAPAWARIALEVQRRSAEFRCRQVLRYRCLLV